MQVPRLARTRSRVVQPGRGTVLDALEDLAFLGGEAVLMMELPRRHSTPPGGGPVRRGSSLR